MADCGQTTVEAKGLFFVIVSVV